MTKIPATKMDLGAKRQCPSCAARFYDLGKNPAKCPKCGTMHDINAPVKTRRRSKATVDVDSGDPLVKEKARTEARAKIQKPKKNVKEIEGIDLGAFEDIETTDTEEEIEELEEIEDIDTLEELEDIEEPGNGDELDESEAIEEEPIGDALVDEVEEVEESEEEESTSKRKSSAKVAVKKPAPKKAPAKKPVAKAAPKPAPKKGKK